MCAPGGGWVGRGAGGGGRGGAAAEEDGAVGGLGEAEGVLDGGAHVDLAHGVAGGERAGVGPLEEVGVVADVLVGVGGLDGAQELRRGASGSVVETGKLFGERQRPYSRERICIEVFAPLQA